MADLIILRAPFHAFGITWRSYAGLNFAIFESRDGARGKDGRRLPTASVDDLEATWHETLDEAIAAARVIARG